MSREINRQNLFTRRAFLVAGGQAALFSLLCTRLYYLQVIESKKYATLAESNRISVRFIVPQRGKLLDRLGSPLADNKANFKAVIIPEQAPDIKETLKHLKILLPELDLAKVLKEIKKHPKFYPTLLKENLTWDEVAYLESYMFRLPGVLIENGFTRFYPLGDLASHLLGYVGSANEEEVLEDKFLTLPEAKTGKNGLEKHHDTTLRGQAGTKQIEVNARGRIIRELSRISPLKGQNVFLTIKSSLQKFVAERLQEYKSASAVVMDVQTGEILSLVSVPGYNPHAFTHGIDPLYWQELSKNPYHPLINKSISGLYPPGSTFKMIVALAALEAKLITPTTAMSCSGYTSLGNHRFHCWKKEGHGRVDLTQAISKSCDVYFYHLSRLVGVDRIAAMSKRLGLGEKTGIHLPNEKGGLIPSTAWKRAKMNKPWTTGETYNTGIGQGYVLTTPLQLALMTARLASGKNIVPILELTDTLIPAPPLDISQEALEIVRTGMERVLEPGGTAYRSHISTPEMAMAGKTGTSQVRRITMAERKSGLRKIEDVPWRERNHALFVGYAPIHAPRYAVSVIVDHGGGGSAVAAPIARDILKEAQLPGSSNYQPKPIESSNDS